MKKILFGVVLLSSAIFFACGDDSSTGSAGSPTGSTELSESSESSSSLRGSSSSLSEAEVNSSETAKSSGSASQYVCDINKSKDIANCSCDEDRKGKLAYNHESGVELVCSFDETMNKWNWVTKKEEKSSSSKGEESKSSSSVNVSLSSSQNQVSSSSSSSGNVLASSSSGFDPSASCKNGDALVYKGTPYICVEEKWTIYVRSSSSIASSSSHKYNPLSVSPLNPDISYGEFVDPRDNVKYATLDIDNKNGPDSVHMAFTIFAQSLAYHDKVVAASEEQDDPDKVEMYCFRDSVEYCMDWYGGLYQWAEAMALPYDCNLKSCKDQIDPDGDGFHQGICPDGWHIMKEKELRAASFVTNIIDFDERIRTLQASVTFSGVTWGSNKSGLSMVATGTRSPREKKVVDFREVSYAWYADEGLTTVESGVHVAIHNHPSYHTYSGKDWGLSVRCVKNY